MSLDKNEVHQGDSLQLLSKLDEGCIDLVFADPPFNIGYKYDVYDDRQTADDYLSWCRQWIDGVFRALKPDGTFWLAIGDEFAAELKILAQQVGFSCRSWVIWYYTFGVNCQNGFSRSHTHLFHFVKDPKSFTFNRAHPRIRVPSARELVYADLRANPDGRLPDNTWITRPQDAPHALSFSPEHDTWYFARVAGTFKEREGFHGCQMPEQLLARIIRSTSQPNELVLDPFCGSGTTVCVAKKLMRNFMGFELSPEYVKYIRQRLARTAPGDSIDGAEDPLSSAPSTAKGKRRKSKDALQTEQIVIQAYQQAKYPVEFLLCDQNSNAQYIGQCNQAADRCSDYVWNRYLMEMYEAGKLPPPEQRAPLELTAKQMEQTAFACEVAWRLLEIDYQKNLTEILCSPVFSSHYDKIAAELCPQDVQPDSTALRLAAWLIRKSSLRARQLAMETLVPWNESIGELGELSLDQSLEHLNRSGAFILFAGQLGVYASESSNMLEQIQAILGNPSWSKFSIDRVRYIPSDGNLAVRYALKSALASQAQSPLNCRELIANPTSSPPAPKSAGRTQSASHYKTLQLF